MKEVVAKEALRAICAAANTNREPFLHACQQGQEHSHDARSNNNVDDDDKSKLLEAKHQEEQEKEKGDTTSSGVALMEEKTAVSAGRRREKKSLIINSRTRRVASLKDQVNLLIDQVSTEPKDTTARTDSEHRKKGSIDRVGCRNQVSTP